MNLLQVVFTETEEPVILDLAPELQSVQQDMAEALTLRVISATIDPSTFEPEEDILLAGDMDHEQYYIDATRLSDAEAILNEAEAHSRRKLAHDGDGAHDWSKWDLDWDQASGTLTMTSVDGPASYSDATELVKTVSYFNPKRGISHELNRFVKLQLFEEYSATPRVSWVEVDVRPIPTPPEVLTTQYPVRCIERAGFVAIDDNVTLYDVDSPNLLSGWLTIEPSVEGDVVEYNETEGLAVAKTGSGQWQASGVQPLATYEEFFRSFRIKNDGPTVRDSNGEYMRRAWFFVDDGSQAWGFRDIEVSKGCPPPAIIPPPLIPGILVVSPSPSQQSSALLPSTAIIPFSSSAPNGRQLVFSGDIYSSAFPLHDWFHNAALMWCLLSLTLCLVGCAAAADGARERPSNHYGAHGDQGDGGGKQVRALASVRPRGGGGDLQNRMRPPKGDA